jgi:hypothetical protein
MSIVPRKNEDFLTFLNDRAEIWSDAAPLLGISAANLAQWTTLVTNANTAFSTASKAKNTAKATVDAQNDAFRAARDATAGLIRDIRNTADRAANPGLIYQTANLPAPQPPSARPAPTQPTDLRAIINPTDGTLTVRWKARDNEGAVYRIARASISDTGELGPSQEVGISGKKSFIDETVPVGVAGVVYTVRGQRGQSIGAPSVTLTVRFSTGVRGALRIASQERSKAA